MVAPVPSEALLVPHLKKMYVTANDIYTQADDTASVEKEAHERTQDILIQILERRGITSVSRAPYVKSSALEDGEAPPLDAMDPDSLHGQRCEFTNELFRRLRSRGIHGIRTLRVMLHNMDVTSVGTLSVHTFTGAFTHLGIRLTVSETKRLLELFGVDAQDETGTAQVDYVRFFACGHGKWSELRLEVVREAYELLCDKCPGKLLSMDCVEASFESSALTQEMCPNVEFSAKEEFLLQWSDNVLTADGIVTWVDFLDYYFDVSWCFDTHHSFIMYVSKSWGFDMDDYLAKKVFKFYAARQGGDGETLELDDFLAMLSELDPQITKEEARAWYDAIDEDDSGEVDLREFLSSKVLKAKRLFEKFDEQHSNSVDQTTMVNILIDLHPALTTQEATALYRYADLDGSGDVSFIEFLQNKLLKLLQIFGEFDKNQGGDLNEAEMKQLLRKQDPFLDDYDITQIYKAIDTDGGGSISFIEFCESQVLRAKMLFDRFDVDRSRALTLFRFRELMLDLDSTLNATELEAIYQLVVDPNTSKVHLGGFLNPNIVKLKLLFDKYDQDRSSHLEPREFAQMLKELFRSATEKEIATLHRSVYPDDMGVSFTTYIHRFKELSRAHDLMQLAKRRQARRKAESKGLVYHG